MSTKETGGPAFPLPLGNQNIDPSVAGMTMRDYFAAKAMQGMLSDMPKTLYGLQWQSNVAQSAYELADIMLEARK